MFLVFHQLGRLNLVHHLGDKAIHLGEVHLLVHQEDVHRALLDVLQILDGLNRDVNLPYRGEQLRAQDVLLVVGVSPQVGEA